MEPLTIATTFATIVNLLATYKSERQSRKIINYQDFLDWLDENKNDMALDLLKKNREISLGIKDTLNKHSEKLDIQLERLNDTIGLIANRMECFSSIVEAVDFKSTLSNQAYSIVEQLVKSRATHLLEIKITTRGNDGNQYVLVGGEKHSNIDYNEPQFIEDDLLSLVDRGFLRLDYGSKGSRMFYVTRAAFAIVN